ncbi:MAG: hypothetical protein GC189_01950 [Alphaproteobacteria bacterium]|nr:hypothetical protein [Alphaproteobacteria bacterium]
MTASFDIGGQGVGVVWIGDTAMFASGEGKVVCWRETLAAPITAHAGAILSACAHPDGQSLLTGGDDGALMQSRSTGETSELVRFGRKWIDHLEASPASGAIVAGVGKSAHILKDGRVVHTFEHASTIGGVSLDAKGRKLAVSHYGGVTVRYALMPDDAGVSLKWAGSHLAVTLSPGADYVISAMQELELHGWRLPEKTDLRMSGYAAKTKRFSWDRRGRHLATSGAPCAVVWPFHGKLGPQGKEPILCGQRDALVTHVAFNPRNDLLAIGYGDGAVWIAALGGDASMTLEATQSPVTALGWRADGAAIAWAHEDGRGGVSLLS